jgi:hypothetical protein
MLPPSAASDLLQRATAAEGGIEAMLTQLAVDRELSVDEVTILGLLRQGYQIVRESIRDEQPVPWSYLDPTYVLFNNLAAETSRLIASPKRKAVSSAVSRQNLLNLTSVRSRHWNYAASHAAISDWPKLIARVREQE